MEEIYPPDSYGASIRFPLRHYFEEFNNILPSEIPVFTFNDDNEESKEKYLQTIKDLMEIDLQLKDLQRISELCSIDHLTCDGENTKDFPTVISENLNSTSTLPVPYLVPIQTKQLEVNKCKHDLEMKKPALELSLGNKRNYHKRLQFTIPPTPQDLKPGSDFIVSILIYRPFAFKYFTAKNASEKLRFNHEILALGQNTLAEVRDAIICSLDNGLYKEVHNTSDDLRALADAKSKCPSGFIFIDNVFYNDLRSSNAVDYSFPIMEWAKEKNIKDLQCKNIENMKINCLTPRFGYPYLYMHQGDCEHLLVFADARLINQHDCLHSQCYPHVLKLNRKANKMCFMCTVSFAKWICIDSDRLPQNKVFLCTECCNAYNYIDGEKVGNFKLYPYYEKHVVT